MTATRQPARTSLIVVAREWGRIGLTGFGGPPAHIALLRDLVVRRCGWMSAHEFEDALATCNLLPGPASTQLAIFAAYRAAGAGAAIVGGVAFVLPAVVLVIALSVPFLAAAPPLWIRGAGAGAGAAVAAVALQAGRLLVGPSLARAREDRARTARWAAYLLAGAAAAALLGPEMVVALLACGAVELAVAVRQGASSRAPAALPWGLPAVAGSGGVGALAWTAFKVGALTFGGGFVIIPLMQSDAVHVHHWMSDQQFLNAVALGQVTPGPVVATVAAVGYAADGVAGGALAALVAFAPSFVFVLALGPRFESFRGNRRARAFLAGAGPAAIGAIFGAAITLAAALQHGWQFGVLAASVLALLLFGRGTVRVLLAAAGVGVILALAGVPV